jgi:transposase
MSERFAAAYSSNGRPGVPPERLLKALLLMALYSVRGERQLIERIDTDLLSRWFLDMDPAEPAFDATVLTHNRPRLDEHGLTAAFFDAVIAEAIDAGLCSHEHLSVDGTLIESYASIKSFRPVEPVDDAPDCGDSNAFKPRSAEVDFHGQKRSNATHRGATDPEARLHRKSSGREARLAHLGHALTENRHGLIMAVTVSEACGAAEVDAALTMVDDLKARRVLAPKALGADRGYDSGPLYLELESRGIEPHAAMLATSRDMSQVRPHQRARVEARERTRARLESEGYRLSRRCRKKVEECFGRLKTIAGLARSRWVGRWKPRQQMELSAAASNPVRLRRLLPA